MAATEACGPAALHVRLRRLEPATILHLIDEGKETHMASATIVLGMLNNAPESDYRHFEHVVELTTGTARALPANDADSAPRNAG